MKKLLRIIFHPITCIAYVLVALYFINPWVSLGFGLGLGAGLVWGIQGTRKYIYTRIALQKHFEEQNNQSKIEKEEDNGKEV